MIKMTNKVTIEKDNVKLSLELNYGEESFFEGTWIELFSDFARLLLAHQFYSEILVDISNGEYEFKGDKK